MGSTINPDGRLRVSSSISSIGTNRYRVSINLSVKSSLTFNEYGINCYAHIGSNKVLMGTFTVPKGTGVCKPSSYTHDFNVTANTEVYASCICTHCDGSDGWSAQSYADTATYTNPNTAPPTPTIKCLNYAAPGKYVLENTLDVELTQVTDPQGDTVRYVAYAQYKNSSGAWQSAGDGNNCILYSTTDRKVSINISQYARGTQFRIWGKAVDTKGASSALTGYIENIYRNQVPGTPNISCTNTQMWNGNYIGESNINIALSTVSDPEGISVSYKIYGQYLAPGSSTWTAMGSGNLVSSTQSTSIDISGYERGTRFKFWGVALDNFGATSANSSEISNIYRNRRPNTISSILPASSTIIGNTIELTWTDPGDPDGQTVFYDVYVSKNDGSYEIINNVDLTRYNYDISSDPPYTKYRFKIVPFDKMTTGNETLSPVYRKDFPPSFILPLNNKSVYQNNPRIVASKFDNTNIYLCVESGGRSYNSKTNSNLFAQNVKPISNGVSMCFKASNVSSSGTDITIYNSDGTFDSSRVTIRLTLKNISSIQTTDSIITAGRSHIITAISDLRSSYDISATSVSNKNKDEIIRKSDLTELRDPITVIRSKINEYDSNKISTNWNANTIIKIEDIQQIIDAIKDI